MNRERRLEGRVALISGGLRGIGLAIARRFVAEGAQVVLGDLDPVDATAVRTVLGELGAAARYERMNVTEEPDWQRVVAAIRARHGRLDCLVNNAGVEGNGAVEAMEFATWRRTMSINVDGVFLGTKTCTPLLAESGQGRRAGSSIINISSIMGLVGLSEISAYSTSKGAVRLFTKAVAIEFAQKRTPIRVNSLHPGFVNTPLLSQGMQRWVDEGKAAKAQDLIDMLAAQTPNGRIADPEEIAGAAFFLASDDSSYVTGAEIAVDGGWTAH
jgi:NAD(P)-dependent dehydrogenase (short-subunit alcohol dehydrogenase family)